MIDQTSLKILAILQEKARIPNAEVARQVGLAPSAVLERVRKLERQGIIDGYEMRLNPSFFKRQLIAFISITLIKAQETEQVGETLAALPEIQEVHYIAGEDGFFVKLRVSGTHELKNFIHEKILSLPNIRSTRTSIVLATQKETLHIPLEFEGIPA